MFDYQHNLPLAHEYFNRFKSNTTTHFIDGKWTSAD